MKLKEALRHPTWLAHKIDDLYSMDGKGEWKIAYYPILGDGQSQAIYDEPRALMERERIFKGEKGTDFREVPLRYIKRL